MLRDYGYISTSVGNIPIEEEYKKIIEHPAFTRLKDISQTGFARHIFPGMEGSRYEHSIATAGIMGIYYSDILYCKNCIGESERKSLNAAALLHDIGHAPFSHITENLIKAYDKDFDHKKHGIEIIEKVENSNGKTIEEILEESGNDVEKVKKIILKKSLLSQILSHTPLGADKFTYIAHDSKRIGDNSNFFTILPHIYLDNSKFGITVYDEIDSIHIQKLYQKYQELYIHVYYSDAVRIVERMLQKAIQEEVESGNIEVENLKIHREFEILHKLYNSENDITKNIIRHIEMCDFGDIIIYPVNEKKIIEFYKNPTNLLEKERELAEVLKVKEYEAIIPFIPEYTKILPDDMYLFGKNETLFKVIPSWVEYLKEGCKAVSHLIISLPRKISNSERSKIEKVIFQ